HDRLARLFPAYLFAGDLGYGQDSPLTHQIRHLEKPAGEQIINSCRFEACHFTSCAYIARHPRQKVDLTNPSILEYHVYAGLVARFMTPLFRSPFAVGLFFYFNKDYSRQFFPRLDLAQPLVNQRRRQRKILPHLAKVACDSANIHLNSENLLPSPPTPP